MLRELRLRALGVIDDASVDFVPGLTAITGETGAGKTMLTTGLGLLLGGRGDAGLVRRGASKALVEGRFADLAPVAPRLDELGAEVDDDEVLVSRQVTDQGRSRAFVGGVQTTMSVLTEVTGHLATIHGQSEQVRLGSPERQREVLDRSCGPDHARLLETHRETFERRQAARAELVELTTSAQARAREADLIRFGLEEIGAVDPQPGEDAELAARARRLQSLDELRLQAERVNAALSGEEFSESPGAVGLVGEARKAAAQLASTDDAATDLAERLVEVSTMVNDVAADVARYVADLEADPEALAHVMDRQAEIARLTRKYGNDVTEVLTWAEQNAARLASLEGSDERIAELEAEIAELEARLGRSAVQITEHRAEAAQALAAAVRDELAALAMPHARLTFELVPLREIGPHGAEGVQLLFAANPGSGPAPLAKVASGGELSRVRLALEVVLAAQDPGHTFVFDEVDAGVGGAVGLEIGRRLARLAQHSQVLVVTHLAQVAAFADQHVVVVKASDGQVTSSGVQRVDGDARLAELARMMGGLESAESAQAHARDLLAEAQRP